MPIDPIVPGAAWPEDFDTKQGGTGRYTGYAADLKTIMAAARGKLNELVGAGNPGGPLAGFETRVLEEMFRPYLSSFEPFHRGVSGQQFGEGQQGDGIGGVGWKLTDINAPTSDEISVGFKTSINSNSPGLYIKPGTKADAGGVAHYDRVGAGAGTFPFTTKAEGVQEYIRRNGWFDIPKLAAGAAGGKDNTTWVFAYRIALTTGTASTWNSKVFLGYAVPSDTSILDVSSGDLTTSVDARFGIHIAENGDISAVAMRAASETPGGSNTALLLAGTSWVPSLRGAAGFFEPFTTFDIVIRVTKTDSSDAAGNGTVEFWLRQVPTAGFTADGPVSDIHGEANTLAEFSDTPDAALVNQTWYDAGATPMGLTLAVANGPSSLGTRVGLLHAGSLIPRWEYF